MIGICKTGLFVPRGVLLGMLVVMFGFLQVDFAAEEALDETAVRFSKTVEYLRNSERDWGAEYADNLDEIGRKSVDLETHLSEVLSKSIADFEEEWSEDEFEEGFEESAAAAGETEEDKEINEDVKRIISLAKKSEDAAIGAMLILNAKIALRELNAELRMSGVVKASIAAIKRHDELSSLAKDGVAIVQEQQFFIAGITDKIKEEQSHIKSIDEKRKLFAAKVEEQEMLIKDVDEERKLFAAKVEEQEMIIKDVDEERKLFAAKVEEQQMLIKDVDEERKLFAKKTEEVRRMAAEMRICHEKLQVRRDDEAELKKLLIEGVATEDVAVTDAGSQNSNELAGTSVINLCNTLVSKQKKLTQENEELQRIKQEDDALKIINSELKQQIILDAVTLRALRTRREHGMGVHLNAMGDALNPATYKGM